MKKLLLLSMLAMGAMAAKADYSEYFKVYYNGEEIQSGQTLQSNHYTDLVVYNLYELDLDVVSQVEYNIVLEADLNITEAPEGTLPQLCFNSMAEIDGDIIPDGNCWNTFPNACVLSPETLSDGQKADFVWQVEAQATNMESPVKMEFKFSAADGSVEYYETIPDTEFVLNVIFSKEEAAVKGVEMETASAPQYFNLQGVRVAEPSNGIYIVKRGNKISKEVVK